MKWFYNLYHKRFSGCSPQNNLILVFLNVFFFLCNRLRLHLLRKGGHFSPLQRGCLYHLSSLFIFSNCEIMIENNIRWEIKLWCVVSTLREPLLFPMLLTSVERHCYNQQWADVWNSLRHRLFARTNSQPQCLFWHNTCMEEPNEENTLVFKGH